MTDTTPACSLLIVEDDLPYRRNMETIVRMEGFRVRTAPDGRVGLELMREELPDLVLCDIMMPVMDGLTFFQALKGDAVFADVPFIFVTALSDRADLRKAMAAGADDYLTKPFSAEELIAAVAGRLSRLNRARRQAGNVSFQKEMVWLRERITPREREVLLMVGEGATSREIAERLRISVKTVEIHRANLMNKLDVSNAATLARWALIAELV